MKTLEKFAEPEDMNIFSEVMESHQKNPAANGKILYYLSENFRYPKDLSSVVYISQVLQAMAMKSGVEHFRRNRGRCMGALYWQINDNWPVASWASIDYYGRWKALHYSAKRFYAPVAASIRRKDGIIALHLANDTDKALNVTAALRIRSLHFDVIKEWNCTASVDADSAACLIELSENELPSDIDKREVFIEGTVTDDSGRTYTECAALVPYKHLSLKAPELRCETVRTEGGYEIRICADSFAPFVEVETTDVDVILSDNYFMISDKAPYVITLKDEDIRNGRIEDAADLAKKLTLRSIWDTYAH
jgi:beta-mannosidase